MPSYYAMQLNAPAFGKRHPRIVKFYIRKEDIPRERDLRNWARDMQRAMIAHQEQARPQPTGKVTCKFLNTIQRRKKHEPKPILSDPRNKDILDILALPTFREAA